MASRSDLLQLIPDKRYIFEAKFPFNLENVSKLKKIISKWENEPLFVRISDNKKESLFDLLTANSPDNDKTQIIISLTNTPHIKVYNGKPGESSPIGPPAPPPSGKVNT